MQTKKDSRDLTPFTEEELETNDIRPMDIYNHLSSNAADVAYFSTMIDELAMPDLFMPADLIERSHVVDNDIDPENIEDELQDVEEALKEEEEDQEEDREMGIFDENEEEEEEIHPELFREPEEEEEEDPEDKDEEHPFEVPSDPRPYDALDLFLKKAEKTHEKYADYFDYKLKNSPFDPSETNPERTKVDEVIRRLAPKQHKKSE